MNALGNVSIRPLARVFALVLAPLSFGLALAPSLAAPAAAIATATDDLTGHWEGSIALPGNALAVELDFTKSDGGALKGVITIPAQGAKNLPLGKISVESDKASFVINGIPGDPTFKGTFADAGATLAGDFVQGGATLHFTLKRGEVAAETAKDALKGFGEQVEAMRAAWKVPGVAVAIVRGDKVIFSEGFGFRDVENKKPVTSKTLFAIGSSTKAFTTFTLATLVDEGKLDWDKPVTTYIPDFKMFDKVATDRMTPRDLVTHRSGLPRHDLLWYNSTITREELVHRLAYLPPSKDFRTDFQYNNLMFMTAGYLIERLTGSTWEVAVKERIFKPLGMSTATFSIANPSEADDWALGYEEREDVVKRMAFRDVAAAGPAGSINASVDEMATWMSVHLGDGTWQGKRVISEETLKDLHVPRMAMGAESPVPEVVTGGYALGWFTDTYRGLQRVHHGGNIDGFSALVCLVPKEHIGIVVLTNMNGTPLTGLIARTAIDRLAKLPIRDWSGEALAKVEKAKGIEKEAKKKLDTVRKAGTSPSHALKEYAGEYEDPGYGIVRVDLVEGRLAFTYNRITTPLDHWHYDTFSAAKAEPDHTFEDVKLLFETDVNGDVSALCIAMDPSVGDVNFKRRPEAQLSDPAYLKRFVGEYTLNEETVKVEPKGKSLTLTVPGQPTYQLVPKRDDSFTLKEASIITIKFLTDAQGKVTSIQFNQPNGVFTATPKAAEKESGEKR